MYIVMAEVKSRGSDEYIAAELSGKLHYRFIDATREIEETRKLNPYYIGRFWIKELGV